MSLSKIGISLFVLIGLGALAYYMFKPEASESQDDIVAVLEKGTFVIDVTATGELNAKRSVKIRAPQGMRPAGIYETTLSDLIAEGTLVTEGDYVATLDRTELAGKMSNVQTEIEKIQTQLEQARIDTAIEMRDLRDQLVNLNFTRKEKELKVEQSKYEPQSVIQQTQLDLERTDRDYGQLEKKYVLKEQQALAKIEEINALLRQNERQLKIYSDLSEEFSIKAPKSGMVIYARSWNGKKEPGARISAWDPIVAELPDLSDMISKTYVNEVDISKVRAGQDVALKVDAFPDKKYTGKVIKVANIGEQLRGYDTKVFEVIVQVNEADSILRPAMTTSNEIVTNVFEDVLFVPLEALYSDSVSFVYKEQKGKVVKQEVIAGLSNDDQVMIDFGLEEGDKVLFIPPSGEKDYAFVPLADEIKAEILKKQEEEEAKRQAQALEKQKQVGKVDLPSDGGGGGGDFIIIMD